MATKKRSSDEPRTTEKKNEGDAPKKRVSRAAGASRKATAVAAAKGAARPRLRASHAAGASKPPRPKKVAPGGVARRKTAIVTPQEKDASAPAAKRTPLGAPKRPARAASSAAQRAPEASSQARELAVSIAIAGLDKKALAIEILDVTGKVDYADFLVVMTGRSDRHVHAISTGIEEALSRKNKVKPLSVEGLSTASWVLLDFGDVVVHVFQEDSRRLYDIEGLWIDAGRVPLPESEQKAAAQVDESDASS